MLVADDDADVRRSFSRSLESHGYDVRTATDGAEALSKVEDEVDIVLLDERMPDRSGGAVLEEIRARNVDCRVALVMPDDPDFDIVTVDCDDYVVEPVDRDELVDTVDRLALLEEYDETRRELGTLRVRRNVLEFENRPSALEESAEFRELEDRIADLEAKLDEIVAEFDDRLGYGAGA